MSSSIVVRTLCAVLLIAVSACGGGGHSVTPAALTTPVASGSTQNGARQTVTIKIDVPKNTGSSANQRHPQYISPATTQMAVSIQTGCPGSCTPYTGIPPTVALTPTSGGCTSSLASTTCQLTLGLQAGIYTASFTTEDASGHALSTAQNVNFTVVTGASNVVAISLSGIPAGIVAAQYAHGSNTFVVNAIDIDGDTIVGPGAPAFSVSSSSNTVTLTQPGTSTNVNTFTATPSATGSAVLTVAATYPSSTTNACTLSGAVCSATYTFAAEKDIFAGGANPTVDRWTSGALGLPQTTFAPSGQNADSKAIAFTSAGNAVATSENTFASEYSQEFVGAPIAKIGPVGETTAAYGIAIDASDNVFVSFPAPEGKIYEYAPPYTGSPIATMSASSAEGIALDAAGDLFVANGCCVLEFAKPYTGAPQTIASGGAVILAVALDSHGNLFYADRNSSVFELPPPYTGSPATVAVTAVANIYGVPNAPEALALDAQNNLYVVMTDTDNAGDEYSELDEFAPPYTEPIPTAVGSIGRYIFSTSVGIEATYSLTLNP